MAEEEKYDKIKETMDAARRQVSGNEVPAAEGMIIDIPGDGVDNADGTKEEDDPERQIESAVPTKATRRKTKQQRRKALRALEEVSCISSTTTHLEVANYSDPLTDSSNVQSNIELHKRRCWQLWIESKLYEAK